MTTMVTDHFELAFEQHRQRTEDPAWLDEKRESALRGFQEPGIPTTRQEAYRFTNLVHLSRMPFRTAEHTPEIPPNLVKPHLVTTATTLVFVNGALYPGLSDIEEIPGDIRLLSFKDAVTNEPGLVDQYLGKLTGHDEAALSDNLAQLNTALFEQGCVLLVGENADCAKPIQVIHLSLPLDKPCMSHPRNLVILGRNARAALIETHLSYGDGDFWCNTVTEAFLDEGAHLTTYLTGYQGYGITHVNSLFVQQKRDSRFTGNNVLMGGGTVRNNIRIKLEGEGADAKVNGLFVGRGRQHMDTDIFMDHAVPHCTSDQFVKGILDEQAKGVFTGRILVREDAQKTDSRQTNRNLLLSDTARIDTKPQLEIYADDVKCAHGATTGQIDQDALFYLQTRGLDPTSAMDLLLYAFAHEALERMQDEDVRHQAESALFERFARARLIEEE